MTNSYDVDHGLSQDEPGPLEPVEVAKVPAAPVAAGWKMVPVEPTDEMETAAENDYEQRGETFPDWKAKYRAMLAAAPAAPVSTVEDAHDAVKRLRDAIEGECSGTWISEKQAVAVLAHLGRPAPAAGDAEVLAALKKAHMALIGFMPQHRNDIIVNAIVAAREAIDAAEAAQRKGGA